MGRYQLDGQTWSIAQDDATLAITEPDGAERAEQFATAADAKRKFTILVNQHLRAGWTLVVDNPAPAAPLPEVVWDARNPELEAALLADPYDRAAWRIYGDWLLERGDLRGQYIALRARCLDDPDDRAAAAELRRLEQKHQARFVTKELSYLGYPVSWSAAAGGARLGWGFLDAVDVTSQDRAHLLAHDQARFVTKVTLDWAAHGAVDDAIAAVAEHASPALRELVVMLRYGTLSDLSPLAPRFAVMRRLALFAQLAPPCIHTLATASLPKLASLGLGHGRVLPVFANASLAALDHLNIDEAADDATCHALVAAPFAAGLQVLELTELSAGGAKILVAERARFARLETISLDMPRCGRALIRALDELLPSGVRVVREDL